MRDRHPTHGHDHSHGVLDPSDRVLRRMGTLDRKLGKTTTEWIKYKGDARYKSSVPVVEKKFGRLLRARKSLDKKYGDKESGWDKWRAKKGL